MASETVQDRLIYKTFSIPEARVAGATACAKGLQVAEDGSQEAPTRIALAI